MKHALTTAVLMVAIPASATTPDTWVEVPHGAPNGTLLVETKHVISKGDQRWVRVKVRLAEPQSGPPPDRKLYNEERATEQYDCTQHIMRDRHLTLYNDADMIDDHAFPEDWEWSQIDAGSRAAHTFAIVCRKK